MNLIYRIWAHPLTSGIDINSEAMVAIHKRIISEKFFLKKIYQKWYSYFIKANERCSHLNLPAIEIGSGAGHLEQYIPDVIKTDIVEHPGIHQVVDAAKLPFSDNSLRAIFVLNALHHFPEPYFFLKEAERCLAKGGYLTLVEPSGSPLQEFFIKKFHPSEMFDRTVKTWENPSVGRLGSCNNAIPYIIFERDREKFKASFPTLYLRSIEKHTFLLYLASGGLSYRSFFPTWSYPLFECFEWLGKLALPELGTEMTITLEKL